MIKINSRIVVIIITITVGLFGFVIYLSNQSAKEYMIADFKTEIYPTEIHGDEGYGSLRSSIFYEEKKGVISSAILINNEYLDTQFWKSHGPTIDLNDRPHHYTIADLKFPYTLSKKANSDTLIVDRDSVRFFFIMIDIK